MNFHEIGELCAYMTGYLWCTWAHRKHHTWKGDYRRDCAKCKSCYVWPDKRRIAELEAQPRLVRKQGTAMTFSSLPNDITVGEPFALTGENIQVDNNQFMCKKHGGWSDTPCSCIEFSDDSPILE